MKNSGRRSCTFRSGNCTIFLVVFILVLLSHARQGDAATGLLLGYHHCCAGCVTQCLFVSLTTPAQKLPCYVNCLSKCFTVTPPAAEATPAPAASPTAYIPLEDEVVADIPVGDVAMADYDGARTHDGQIVVNESSEFLPHRPPQTTPHRYYCFLGCTMESCMMVTPVGGGLKTCMGKCTNMCKP